MIKTSHKIVLAPFWTGETISLVVTHLQVKFLHVTDSLIAEDLLLPS